MSHGRCAEAWSSGDVATRRSRMVGRWPCEQIAVAMPRSESENPEIGVSTLWICRAQGALPQGMPRLGVPVARRARSYKGYGDLGCLSRAGRAPTTSKAKAIVGVSALVGAAPGRDLGTFALVGALLLWERPLAATWGALSRAGRAPTQDAATWGALSRAGRAPTRDMATWGGLSRAGRSHTIQSCSP